mmetsp:Transcript_10159/g.35557  ORF Transcript_10159/g.35557 Transcript_10159/m.35557 type:complete len:210 (-) Transcript_10159:8-637(-)
MASTPRQVRQTSSPSSKASSAAPPCAHGGSRCDGVSPASSPMKCSAPTAAFGASQALSSRSKGPVPISTSSASSSPMKNVNILRKATRFRRAIWRSIELGFFRRGFAAPISRSQSPAAFVLSHRMLKSVSTIDLHFWKRARMCSSFACASAQSAEAAKALAKSASANAVAKGPTIHSGTWPFCVKAMASLKKCTYSLGRASKWSKSLTN